MMFFNKVREYIVKNECLIRHGKGVCNDGTEVHYDLLEQTEKTNAKLAIFSPAFVSRIQSLHENPYADNGKKQIINEPSDTPDEKKERNIVYGGVNVKEKYETQAAERDGFSGGHGDRKVTGEAGDAPGNIDRNDSEDKLPEQRSLTKRVRTDMPDYENENVRDMMEKIRIFEEKVDKVRKMKFIKKY